MVTNRRQPEATVLTVLLEDRSGPEFERLCFAYLLRKFGRWGSVLVGLSAVVSCSGSWVLGYGGKSCSIREGMTIDEVRAACGAPTSSGTTPEVWQRSGCSVTACSAPGDIFETWLVRYDCSRRVMKVEGWPAASFVEGM